MRSRFQEATCLSPLEQTFVLEISFSGRRQRDYFVSMPISNWNFVQHSHGYLAVLTTPDSPQTLVSIEEISLKEKFDVLQVWSQRHMAVRKSQLCGPDRFPCVPSSEGLHNLTEISCGTLGTALDKFHCSPNDLSTFWKISFTLFGRLMCISYAPQSKGWRSGTWYYCCPLNLMAIWQNRASNPGVS